MSLARKTLSSTAWSTTGLVLDQAINLLRLAILARLLTPADFGLYAMAMVFYLFLMTAGDLGMSAAIVQRKSPSESLLSTIFYTNLGFGLCLTLLVYFAAPVAGSLYAEPKVTDLLRWMSILFLVSATGFVHSALMRKELDFKRLTLARVFANVVSSIACVYLAYQGFGYYSFGFQVVAHASLFTLSLWVLHGWVPRAVFSMPDLRSVFAYSANLTGFNFIEYAAANADKFLVGKFLGSTALGAYYLGFRLILMPMRQVIAAVKNVVFSVLAKVQDDNRKFREIFLKVVYLISFFTAPFTLLFCVTADLVTDVLFGEKWSQASAVLAILAPAGMLQAIVSPAAIICLVKDRTDILFKLSLLALLLLPGSVFIGLQFGLVGVALGYTLASLAMAVPSLFFTLRLADMQIIDMIKAVAQPVLASLFIAVLVWLARNHLLAELGWTTIVELFVLLASAAAVYLLMLNKSLRREVSYIRARVS